MPGTGGPSCEEPLGRIRGIPFPLVMPLAPARGVVGPRGRGGVAEGDPGCRGGAIPSVLGLLRLAMLAL